MARAVFWVCVCVAVLHLWACKSREDNPRTGAASSQPATAAQLRIAVIPKGTTHVFWKSVERGAKQAGTDLGVEIIWKGPLKENDRAQQIQVMQQFISEKVSAIAVAPLDFRALAAPVRSATQAGIPVVIFDSALDGEPGKDFVSFVATNNRKGGELAGEKLAELLGKHGKVVLLRYAVGSASTDEREAGFLSAIQQNPGIEIISENRYAGATTGEAKSQALNMLDQVRAASGIFCPNESSTAGMLLALQQENLAGKVKFVGFDASPPLVNALRAGEVDALIVQNPRFMGNKAVEMAVKHLRGEHVPAVVDTGVAVVTRDNMDRPDIKSLIE